MATIDDIRAPSTLTPLADSAVGRGGRVDRVGSVGQGDREGGSRAAPAAGGSGGRGFPRRRLSPAVAVVILSPPCAPPGSAPEWVFSPCRSSLRGARLGYSLRGRDRQRHVGGQLLLADRARAMRPYYRLIAPGTMPRPGSYRVPTAPIFAVVEFIPASSRIRYTLSNPVQCEPRK